MKKKWEHILVCFILISCSEFPDLKVDSIPNKDEMKLLDHKTKSYEVYIDSDENVASRIYDYSGIRGDLFKFSGSWVKTLHVGTRQVT